MEIFLKAGKRLVLRILKVEFVASIFFYFNTFNLLDFIPLIKTALTGSSGYFISAVVFNAAMLAGICAKSIAKKTKGWLKEYLVSIVAIIILIELYPGLSAFSYGWTDQKTENFVNPPQLIQAWDFIK